ncbi:uncharacterized protein [Diabrotica undecimpunctata]|uniref:uncharacterized protein n=1 Tax=Diabrotica undecimpunctata TaxID=50387 RepID=UPI003B63F6C2
MAAVAGRYSSTIPVEDRLTQNQKSCPNPIPTQCLLSHQFSKPTHQPASAVFKCQNLLSINRHSRKRPSVPGSSLVPNQGSGRTHGQRAEGAKNPRVVGGYQERRKLHIITYNVRTISKDEKMTELEEELKHVKWYIIGISEVKRRGEDQIKLKSGNIFHYKGETESTTGGIGLLVHKKLQKNIQSIDCISPRIMYINLRLNNR